MRNEPTLSPSQSAAKISVIGCVSPHDTLLSVLISGTFSGEQLALDIPYTVIGILIVVGVLLRFGLLALCVTFFVFMLLGGMPLTADFSMPYAAVSTWLLLSTAALAAFGFYASRGKGAAVGTGSAGLVN